MQCKLLKDMKNKNILIISCILGSLTACQEEPHFTITGAITGAKDKTLYLEESGISAITAIDSMELGSSGSFTLKGKKLQQPEFYRLRIDNNIINLVVDSTETVEIKADFPTMTTQYSVKATHEGNTQEENEKIKELTLKQMKLQAQIENVYKDRSLAPYQMQDSVASMLTRHKQDVKMNYIYRAPNRMYAYFALFQRINNFMLFSPNDAADVHCFGAVATSFDNLYPHSVRSSNLHKIALNAMKNTRAPKQTEITLPADKVTEAGLINICLKDQNGKERNLTDLKGKVVLLDFTVYQNDESPARNMALHDIYDKYHNRGLEIYQISLDGDSHYWKTAADNLPWICVNDSRGAYSNYLPLYNVRSLPTYFLINRNNELKLRQDAIKDLGAEIEKML